MTAPESGSLHLVRRVPRVDTPLEGCSPLLSRVYRARGVSSVSELDYRLASLAAPDQLAGLHEAAGVLAGAIMAGERILIIGDYDADGATSTALAVSALKALGAGHVDYLIPDRFACGYGLSEAVVELAREHDPQVLVTVDNGIASVAGVARARALGMKVVITDHHLPGDTLPDADAIVNPNQPGCRFPWKSTAGVGVIFYVLSAVRQQLRAAGWAAASDVRLADWLDLVALGTVADLVPLEYNNRILVAAGLARMRREDCRPGIRALLDVAGRDLSSLSAQDLAFSVAPRLNAAGRLENMAVGVECLLARDLASARAHAEALDDLNRQRREIEQDMRDRAESILRGLKKSLARLPAGLCLFDEGWHEGVIGIVASRIKERVYRPVVVMAPGEGGLIKGSGRSIPGFHLRDALDCVANRHPGLLSRFGGHAMAAGLTIEREKLETFRRAFETVAREWLGEQPPGQRVETDGPLAAEEMTLASALELEAAGPWGQGFPEPVFDGWFEVLAHRQVGQKHLKLTLTPEGQDQVVDAILFNFEHWDVLKRCRRVHLAYQLNVNRYQGRTRLQLLARHWLGHD